MLIVIAELLFWAIIIVGMFVRYALRRTTAGKLILWLVPVIDVVLIVAVIAQLQAARPVELAHQLAGLYLGVSLVLGPAMIRWADSRASAWSRGEKAGSRKDDTFQAKMRSEFEFLFRWVAAVGIGFVINRLLMFVAVNTEQREALAQASTMPLGSIVIVALFGPGWHLLFGSKTMKEKNGGT